jgi:hypothetical protein
MSAQKLPGAGPDPAGTRRDPALLGPPPAPAPRLPRHHAEPLLPRGHEEEPPGGWPGDDHLPDEGEDDEC